MRYTLAVLTHGGSAQLAATLSSYRQHVRPEPTKIRVFADAVADVSAVVGTVRAAFPHLEAPEVVATHPTHQQGFCRATGRLWALCAADSDVDYVFWLEHDFLVERTVLLDQMASVLDVDTDIAQMALVRHAANAQEKAAGGLIESRPRTFTRNRWNVEAEDVEWVVEWLDHRAFFTTNPSLMRRTFMAEHPWIEDDRPQCEGRFGIYLAGRGYRFGFWGDGTPWVRHVGERDGIGY